MTDMNPAYKYEFGTEGATWPTLDPDERWSIVFFPRTKSGEPSYHQTPLQYACLQTAEAMAKEAEAKGQNIRLHLSGGDDSKIMIRTFMALDIPFQLTTRVHKIKGQIVNQADADAAAAFCVKHNLHTDVHVIDDLDLRWGDTEHKFFLDMTALSARLGWERYSDEYNVLATTPYLLTDNRMERGDWTLLPTFSMSPNFLNSFFLHDSNIFRAQLMHPVIDMTRNSRQVLRQVANSVVGAERWSHLADVFAYEQIVKPILLRADFPWLCVEGRQKNTGFDTAPADMNTTQPPINEKYRELLKQKMFRVPVRIILEIMGRQNPVRFWMENGILTAEELPKDYQ